MAIGNTAVVSPGLPLTGRVGESSLDRDAKLEAFLAEVEKRAWRMARFAIGDADEALDITQDAMIRLVDNYADRPPGEWQALFFRILQNRIRDHQRRQGVRRRVMALLPGRGGADEPADAVPDPLQSAPDPAPDALPERQLEMADVGDALQAAIAALPRRQQQTFLLRAWEGLDVAETARAMGCSEGSVKTHYSRAVHALRARLGEHWE